MKKIITLFVVGLVVVSFVIGAERMSASFLVTAVLIHELCHNNGCCATGRTRKSGPYSLVYCSVSAFG